jgi:hypothetical protein
MFEIKLLYLVPFLVKNVYLSMLLAVFLNHYVIKKHTGGIVNSNNVDGKQKKEFKRINQNCIYISILPLIGIEETVVVGR